jgi:uncharacterized protein YbjT (DUF2867 family)
MSELILVTGASGYIGGRLVPRLLEAGYRVRCLVRGKTCLQGHAWLDRVEVYAGDALEPASLLQAVQDVSGSYYLIHGTEDNQLDAVQDL